MVRVHDGRVDDCCCGCLNLLYLLRLHYNDICASMDCRCSCNTRSGHVQSYVVPVFASSTMLAFPYVALHCSGVSPSGHAVSPLAFCSGTFIFWSYILHLPINCAWRSLVRISSSCSQQTLLQSVWRVVLPRLRFLHNAQANHEHGTYLTSAQGLNKALISWVGKNKASKGQELRQLMPASLPEQIKRSHCPPFLLSWWLWHRKVI